jgi:hypothetical protein
MQLIIDIPDDQAVELERLSASRHTSSDVLVRDVLAEYLSEQRPKGDDGDLLQFFGFMKGRIDNGLAFQERLRNEWVREWDPEYKPESL